jgi:hypothetical protein
MPNMSVYIKDGALLKSAKELAGEDGFSALIAKALADFVERRRDESRGLTDYSILVDPSLAGLAPDESYAKLIRFKGRSLASALMGRGPYEEDADAEVYQTRAGRLILVLRDRDSGEAYDYEVYESLDQLAADQNALAGVPPTQRHEFIDRVAEAMGQQWAVWID